MGPRHILLSFTVISQYTPNRKDGLTPAQKLVWQPVQDILPAHHRTFLPEWQCPMATAAEQRQDHLTLSTAFYNQQCPSSVRQHSDRQFSTLSVHNVPASKAVVFIISICPCIKTRV